jgi:hypothetical protein
MTSFHSVVCFLLSPLVCCVIRPPLIHDFSARDQSVADMFGAYWSSFVYNNSPNGGSVPVLGLPNWPLYATQGTLNHLQLDLPPQPLANLRKAQCDFWDSVKVPNYPQQN